GLALLRQPAHWRRTQFVDRLQTGDLQETVRELAALTPAQFSPQWDPSAALAHRQAAGRLLEAVLLAVDLPAGSWVRARFLERLRVMIPAWIDSSVIWLVQEDRMNESQL